MILFYLSLFTNILAVREELWKENKWNQLSLILVCQNGSHLRLADLTCPPGHKHWSGSVLPSKSLGPLFPLELHNSKQKWPVCVQRHRRESRGLFSRASSSVLFCFVLRALLYIVKEVRSTFLITEQGVVGSWWENNITGNTRERPPNCL